MTETQILAIVASLGTPFLAVMFGVLISNNRLNDVKDLNNNRLNDVKDLLSAKVETRASAKDLYELRVLIEKNHSEMLLKMSDTDNRLSRIENERRLVGG